MSKAVQALTFINAAILKGQTVYIQTARTTTRITPATAKKWENSKHELFIIDKEGYLRIASGKHYNIIVTPTTSLVKISAQ